MNLTISSTNLLKALMDVSKAIPSKSPLPILENFLFVLKDGKLEITASDSELTLRTAIEVESAEQEGSVAVPARHMTDLLKGPKAIGKKVVEEAGEAVIEAVDGNRDRFIYEASDLVYHLLVLLESMDVSLTDLEKELSFRHK